MQLSTLVARGRVVAAARMLAGLDQHQLAAAAGLSPSTISKIEQGRKNVRQDTAGRSAERWSSWASISRRTPGPGTTRSGRATPDGAARGTARRAAAVRAGRFERRPRPTPIRARRLASRRAR